MEQSKLISEMLMKLKTVYPYYFEKMDEKQIASLFKTYQEELSQYNEETIRNAIKGIIRSNKYMPSLSEIIEQCEANRINIRNDVIEKMYSDGYFKRGQFCELDSEQEYRNYNKALKFVEEGIIPDWLLRDMKKYGYEDGTIQIGTDIKMIGTEEEAKNDEFTEEDEKEFDKLLNEVLEAIENIDK